MIWDRHEIETRNKLHEIFDVYELKDELFGVPEEIKQTFIVFPKDAIFPLTDEIYTLLKEEMLKYERENRPD